ncbi:NADH:flavorubredoxin reductase NorW [Pseudomonas auratipiscis]|uniref:NADH:flavorubredoxin reductase NorW n=1 Tax=Pseudomonas auratipiscis TaxID=3115853 RepID=A0AB35WW93_9PSED|nr:MULTISPECIES: NADH:flavorubredoxin reductase NorW [unclassified Pseudomonas]MEE1867913.1 NADH:flavorubredoxin reductase NorW [Pseudomonas sp. 120P]MEE1959503.1 NADH:flavorubredoxin reductase NorW [Pseudomonas sp. 119P]
MNKDIVIVGSGFAARQVVKNLRKLDSDVPIRLIAADTCDEYNKPDLSHVISLKQSADDMTRQSAGDFAEMYRLTLNSHCQLTAIDRENKRIVAGNESFAYDKLILATGAQAIVPPIPGREWMVTLNSQQEYRRAQEALREAQRVLILGAGLIGTELAMDANRAGKQVILLDKCHSLLASLLPVEVSSRLQHRLCQMGVEMLFNQGLESIEKTNDGLLATLSNGRRITTDVIIASIGLKPDTTIAAQAGLWVDRGIEVDERMCTSDPHIFAVGDCAQIQGKLLPFLQPIQLSAMALARNVLGGNENVKFPAMLVKVKTPEMPLHLAGETSRKDLQWQISLESQGLIARGLDMDGQLRAFVVSEDQMKQAFALLRQLTL